MEGAGSFTTLNGEKFIFDDPGVYTLLNITQTQWNPGVQIQVRLERYPNRRVDFGKIIHLYNVRFIVYLLANYLK